MRGGREIFGLKMGFGKDKVGWFSNSATIKRRVPVFADLRNLFETWV